MTNPIVVEKSTRFVMVIRCAMSCVSTLCRALWSPAYKAGSVFFHARENLNRPVVSHLNLNLNLNLLFVLSLGLFVVFGQCYGADSVDQTAQKLTGNDRKAMFSAINSLAALNQPAADLALKNFYSALSENYVKMQVLQAVAANPSPAARAIIRLGLKDPNEYVRKAAVQALSFAPDEAQAVKDLSDTLNVEKNLSVRGHALTALSNFSSTSAVAAVGTELGNKNNSREHRLNAARALQRMNTKQSRDHIEKYRNDPQISDELKAIPKAGK